MRTIITVSKTELSAKPLVESKVRDMSWDFSDLGHAYSFSPKPGLMFELLKLLRDEGIAYSTEFNFGEEQRSS